MGVVAKSVEVVDLSQAREEELPVEQSWWNRTFSGLEVPDVDISPQEVND